MREQDGSTARVLIDGKDVGATPWEGDLPAGLHAIVLAGDKIASPPQSVEVKAGGKVSVVLDAKATTGGLSVSTTPADATIVVDGKEVGKGTWSGDVAPGAHEVKVTATGYDALTRTVTVGEGQKVEQALALAQTAALPPVETPLSEEDRSTGFYLDIGLAPATTLTSHPGPACSGDVACKDLFPFGGGGTVRLGYMFDWIGFEAVGGFMAQTWFTTRTFPGTGSHIGAPPGDLATVDSSYARDETYRFLNLGAFAGLGARTSSHGETRFTAGLAAGVAMHQAAVHRDLSNGVSDSYAASTSYRAPGFLFDAGVLFSAPPGTRFHLGVLAWLDLPSSDGIRTPNQDPYAGQLSSGTPVYVPTPGYLVAKGPQLYIGPTFAIQLGH